MFQETLERSGLSAEAVHTAVDHGGARPKLVSFQVAADVVVLCEALVIIGT